MNKFYLRFLFLSIQLTLLCYLALPSQAHWADMAAMEIDISETSAEAHLTVGTPFFESVDTDKNGVLSPEEITAGRETIEKILSPQVQLMVNHEAAHLEVKPEPVPVTTDLSGRGNMSTLFLSWTWKKPLEHVALHYDLFPEEAPAAHCLVSVNQQGEFSSWVLNHQRTQVELQEMSFVAQVRHFVTLGLEHIVTGYDHLLFLLALLLVGSRLKYLLKIVTAFTLAHSITLSLAVLGWIYAPARVIESLIAASIMYVIAVEVLWKKKETPAYIVFGFGLIHGLGFANILKEMALPTAQLATGLVSFNIGIELGQLSIVLILWGLIKALQRKPKVYSLVRTLTACAIFIMASIWLYERAILGL